ncbi:hypothetical protein HMPREF0322_05007 [Desulfitobacterium hafniense DP7]|uniref:Uncharacterized protein n=1 Tax=Desulfitobacterium hafniense DP7 TaxID=537010 RepID=G9XVJ4_DESHA|nr:hypothetical protein HMPREF0322_05007 [Desulfitobacterium hafniense DP7]
MGVSDFIVPNGPVIMYPSYLSVCLSVMAIFFLLRLVWQVIPGMVY